MNHEVVAFDRLIVEDSRVATRRHFPDGMSLRGAVALRLKILGPVNPGLASGAIKCLRFAALIIPTICHFKFLTSLEGALLESPTSQNVFRHSHLSSNPLGDCCRARGHPACILTNSREAEVSLCLVYVRLSLKNYTTSKYCVTIISLLSLRDLCE